MALRAPLIQFIYGFVVRKMTKLVAHMLKNTFTPFVYKFMLKMLPPYSPFLNIVEQAISSLKAAIKGDVPRPEIQVRMESREEARRLGIPLGEMRTRLLLDAFQRCIGVITAAKAYQWFRFMQTYLPRCLNARKLKANNVLCIYLQSSLHLFTNSC